MISFLTEIIGLTMEQVSELRNTPGAQDVLPIVSATLPREAEALASADPPALAAGVTAPVLLLLGEASPAWAADITHALARRPPAGHPGGPAGLSGTRPSTPRPA